MLHRISHLLRLNKGVVQTFYWGADMVVCFECATCGELQSISRVVFRAQRKAGADPYRQLGDAAVLEYDKPAFGERFRDQATGHE